MNRIESVSTRPASAISFPAIVLDLAAVGLVGAAGVMLAARLQVAPLALGMIAAGLALRVYQYRVRLAALPLSIPWFAFLLTTALSAGIAFDAIEAQRKFLLILAGIALYFALATIKTPLAARIVIWGLLLICAGSGLYYMTQTDFVAEPAKLALANEIGLQLHRFAPQFGWHTPHPNLIAGILLLGLPFAIGECFNTAQKKQWLGLVAASAISLLLLFALFMTTSRGAWAAAFMFFVLGVLVYGAMRIARRAGYSSNIGIAFLLNLILLAVIVVVATGGGRLANFMDTIFGTVAGVPRLALYTQVYQLIQDYFWTGAGLETFSPNFSTYLLLIDVPFLSHSHNLYLQIWFEQGIFGLLAFLWVLVAFYLWVFQRRKRMNWIGLAGLAAVTMMLVHGLVDVPLYFSRVIPLMFVPFGLTVYALAPLTPLEKRDALAARRMNLAALAIAAILAFAAFVFALVELPVARAGWEANRGALAQAQVELPPVKFQNQAPARVRRTADLQRADEGYDSALAIDPHNREARARLGIIALDREDFETAVDQLELAFAADPTHRATIKALGMAYVWTGQIEQAAPLLKQIPEAERELRLAQWKWRQRKQTNMEANAAAILERLK